MGNISETTNEKIEEKVNILFVDDQKDFLELAEYYLGEKNSEIEIKTFTSLKEAFNELGKEATKFDLVVSDYRIIETNEIESLQQIREQYDLPFIILTEKNREEVAVKALNLGAEYYMEKRADAKHQFELLEKIARKQIEEYRTRKEKKDLYEKLNKQNRFINDVFETIQDGISVLDKNLKIRKVNEVMKKWYEKNQPLEGKYCYEAYHNRGDICLNCPSINAIKTKKTERGIVKGIKGSKAQWIELFSYPMINKETGEVTGIVEFVRDITPIVEIEKKLYEQQQRFDLAIKGGQLGVWDLDLEQNTIYLSDGAKKILKLPEENNDSYISVQECINIIHPEDFDRVKQDITLHIEDNNKNFQTECRILCGDNEYRWFSIKGKLVTYEEKIKGHTALNIIGIVTDISKTKWEQQNEYLLSLLLNHELRNKLNIVMGYLELMKNHSLTEEEKQYKKKAEQQTEESLELLTRINTIRKITYRKEKKLEPIKIKPIIENLTQELKEQLKRKKIQLEVNSTITGEVYANSLLQDALLNIVSNAIQHAKCSLIRISEKNSQEKVKLTIEDDGIGIKDLNKNKLFTEGYKRKESKGLGLGLYLTKMLIESYNGTITVNESELGGVQFIIELDKVKK